SHFGRRALARTIDDRLAAAARLHQLAAARRHGGSSSRGHPAARAPSRAESDVPNPGPGALAVQVIDERRSRVEFNYFSSAGALTSAGSVRVPIVKAMYCLPSTM